MKYRFVTLFVLLLFSGVACRPSDVSEEAVKSASGKAATPLGELEVVATVQPTETVPAPLPSPAPTKTLEPVRSNFGSTSDTLSLETPMKEKIAFSYSDSDNYDIYITNVDGSNLTRLTDSPADDVYPLWSPTGRQIAFIAEQDEQSEIYVIEVESKNLIRLAEGKSPVWSPDGQQLAFVSERDGVGEIYLIQASGGEPEYLTDGFAPAWSPDGQKIAFQSSPASDSKIFIINTDGTGLKHIIDTAGDPVWSPDGQQIAFTSYYAAPPSKVYVVNADGSNLTRLTDGAGPVWSPDGQRIVFTNLADARSISYSVINADGSGETSLISGVPNLRNSNLAWSPDSKQIVLVSGRDGLGIDVIDIDNGDHPVRLTSDDGVYAFPVWSRKPELEGDSSNSTGSSSEGIILFLSSRDHDPDPETAASPTGPAQNRTVELYVMKPDGSQQTRLSDGNRDWWNGNAAITSYHIPNQVVINDKYVFDLTSGQVVEELLLEYPDPDSSTPLKAHYASTWSPDGDLIFISDKIGHGIYYLDSTGDNPQQLTFPPDNVVGDAFPNLSPDREWLVFTRMWNDNAQDGLWLIKTDGSEAHRIIPGSQGEPHRAFWSPDGSQLVFEGPKSNSETFTFEVWVAEADGSNAQQLTSLDEYTGAWEPKWSPDGKRIVFHGGSGVIGQIYVIDAEGGEPQQLTTIGHANLAPLWLPLSFDNLHIPSDSDTTSSTTPTPAPKPVVVAPTTTPVTTPTCPTSGAQITSPAPGTRFTERYNQIVGTANINQFHHWKIEYSTNPGGSWNFLFEQNYPIDNDELMMFDASTVPNGPYGLRLTVVDATGNYPEPCEIWYVNGY